MDLFQISASRKYTFSNEFQTVRDVEFCQRTVEKRAFSEAFDAVGDLDVGEGEAVMERVFFDGFQVSGEFYRGEVRAVAECAIVSVWLSVMS